MSALFAGIELKTAGHFSIADRNYRTGYRLSDCVALHLYAYSGTMRLEEPAERFAFQPGDLSFTPRGAVSGYDLPEPGVHRCLHFKPGTWKLPLPLFRRRDELPGHLAEDIDEIIELADEGAWSAATLALELLLMRLERHRLKQRNDLPDERVAALAEAIRRCPEQPFQIGRIAAELRLGVTHLGRLFRVAYGCSIRTFLMRQRIGKAQFLLHSTRLSIKEIGAAVGYSSNQEFNKRFRQVVHISPSGFRAGGRPE